jgi:hypothetical protein
MPADVFFSPFSPLAAPMVRESFESGTMWPSTTSVATSARKNGHGLLGETVVWGVSPEMVPTRSSGIDLDPKSTD